MIYQPLLDKLPADKSPMPYVEWRNACMTDDSTRTMFQKFAHTTRRQGAAVWVLDPFTVRLA